jgi:mono/diheme cytochrome c family protein
MDVPRAESIGKWCAFLGCVAMLFCLCAADDDGWTAPQYAAGRKNPVAPDARSIAAGHVAYAQQCLGCHGSAGKGDGPDGADLQPAPCDLTCQEVQTQPDGAIFWKITNGRTPMPGFQKTICDDDRWNVVNYLHTLGAGGQKGAEK